MKFIPQFVYRKPLFPFLKSEQKELFDEAIYLTSPSLKNEYKKYENGKISSEKEINKLKISYYKYLSRSSSRCTPFGLFAGIGTGVFGNESKIIFDSMPENCLQRRTRLDMNIICNLAKELSKKESIKPYLNYFPNSSLYMVDTFYRYVEYYYQANRRVHKISKVDFSEYLEAVLTSCINGKNINELVEVLVNLEIDLKDANNFIDQLIDFQLIISDLEPTVTGEEFFEKIVSILHKIEVKYPSNEIQNFILILNEITYLLDQIDTEIVNNGKLYDRIYLLIKKIIGDVSETNLFQTDAFFTSKKAVLNKTIQDSIIDTIAFLNKITPSFSNINLEKFKKNFNERYDDQEVPLLEVLDVETGIGYLGKNNSVANELIDDLYFPVEHSDFEMKWNHYQSKIFNLLLKAYKNDEHKVTLIEKDFDEFDFTDNNLPHSLAVKFDLLDAETNKIAIDGIGGASATSLLGRFGHGSKEIQDILLQITNHETQQADQNILAEIIHLPEQRIGNILSRPAIRGFEIPYLAKSSIAMNNQIPLSDLCVSVKQGKIILRSKKLNKQVIPRMSNAHNYSFNSLPVYHFLCDLQSQYFSKNSLFFSWGNLASQFTFLPRVEYKNVVLLPATWQLNKKDFEILLNEKSREKLKEIFIDFMVKFKIPQLFLVADGDNELLIDSNNEIAVLTFIDTLKNRSSIKLKEILYDFSKPLISDESSNSFTNECIAVILNDGKKIIAPNFEKNNVEKDFDADFLPGNHWLYFKIYAGIKTADFILSEKIKPMVTHLLEKGYIKKWFFIRYYDTDNHLRFRVQLNNNTESDIVLKQINNVFSSLFQKNIIAKIQIESYQREIFRYGKSKIEDTENLFFSDSVFCINTIDLLDPESANSIRWQIALRATVQYLDDFGLSLLEKEKFCQKVAENFFYENKGNAQFKKQLNEKYRKTRSDLEDIMNLEKDQGREIKPILELIDERSERNKTIIKKLKLNKNSEEFHGLLFSYIHMMHNRLFISDQRKTEFIIYDLLARHYKSVLARMKYELV